MFLCLLLSLAQAIPVQLSQQGRILDSNGTPVEGNQFIRFALYEELEGGNPLWEESLYLTVTNGYFSTVLGDNPLYPIDASLLATEELFLEIDINNTPLEPRQTLNSVPYSRIAEKAESIDGGTVDAAQISVGGQLVVDGSGEWVGPSISPNWNNLSGIPAGFSDNQDNDTQLSEGEVINYVVSTGIDLHSDTTLNGNSIATSQDTIASISCADGEILLFDLSNSGWTCGQDSDTTLSSAEIQAMVEAMSTLALQSGVTVGGSAIVTESTLSWSGVANRPAGLDDGDDNTQLSDSEVLQAVESTPVDLALASSVNGQPLLFDPGCADKEVLQYNATSGTWECAVLTSALDADGDGIYAWNDCDDNDSAIGEGTGLNSNCPATSCLNLLNSFPTAASGTYWINPQGMVPFQVECDMDTDGGGWVVLEETSNYSYTQYSEGNEEQLFSYTLSDAQINAIKAVSSEATQDYQCQTVGVGDAYDLKGWSGTIFDVSSDCWASNNSDFKSSTGTLTDFNHVPLQSWFSIDCGDSSESCQHNVENAYIR